MVILFLLPVKRIYAGKKQVLSRGGDLDNYGRVYKSLSHEVQAHETAIVSHLLDMMVPWLPPVPHNATNGSETGFVGLALETTDRGRIKFES